MSNIDKTNKHFNSNKKEHTEIKHYLFGNILTKSISIANNLSKNKNSSFVYIDLFSGAGIFEDNTYGSPLIAAKIINKLENSNINNFKNIKIVAIDKEQSNINKLTKKYYEIIDNNKIIFSPYCGSWEDYSKEVSTSLDKSDWGFVFADPFSTELAANKFINTIKNNVYVKDILIFYNYNTLNRQNARNYESDKERVKSTIGAEVIDENIDFKDFFKQTIIKNLHTIKNYIIGISFPVTKNNKLTNSNYFYLVFCTDSVVLVNEFLLFYENCLIHHTKYRKDNPIAFTIFIQEIEQYIEESQSITLLGIKEKFTSNFFEWKNYSTSPGLMPTTENILEIINHLYKEKSIVFDCDSKYIYKKTINNKIPGMLNNNMIKSKHDYKSIIININHK